VVIWYIFTLILCQEKSGNPVPNRRKLAQSGHPVCRLAALIQFVMKTLIKNFSFGDDEKLASLADKIMTRDPWQGDQIGRIFAYWAIVHFG
jgi:hypothetical protein